MVPPIHLGAWSMALMLWLPFELLLLLLVARLPGVFHVYARSNIATPEGLRNITERIHVEGPLVYRRATSSLYPGITLRSDAQGSLKAAFLLCPAEMFVPSSKYCQKKHPAGCKLFYRVEKRSQLRGRHRTTLSGRFTGKS